MSVIAVRPLITAPALTVSGSSQVHKCIPKSPLCFGDVICSPSSLRVLQAAVRVRSDITVHRNLLVVSLGQFCPYLTPPTLRSLTYSDSQSK